MDHIYTVLYGAGLTALYNSMSATILWYSTVY